MGTMGWTPARARRRFAPVAALAIGAAVGACGVRTPGVERFPELAEFAGDEIRRVAFEATNPFPADTLRLQIETEPTHCRLLGLPICLPGGIGERRRFLNLETLRRDVLRLEQFYDRSGYFGTEVNPRVERVDGDEVTVTFVIGRGVPVIIEVLRIQGIEGIVDPDSLRRRLPLQRGELFNRERFVAAADTLLRILRRRGHAYADVLRNYDLDFEAGRANAELLADAGPPVVVDSIVVLGAERLGRGAVLRQLTFRPGDLLIARELVESQRNLYNLPMVQVAAVRVAPPEQQVAPADSSRATVEVSVSETPRHLVEAAVGFGTVECFRGQAEWVDRNFAGDGRRLALRARAARIGASPPVNLGICPGFETAGPFQDRMDYRLIAELTQPWFLSPRHRLTASVFAARESEPNVFQREAWGGSATIARRLGPRHVVTPGIDIERGRTLAVPAVLCAAFEICLPNDIEELARTRWRNTLSIDWTRDRSQPLLDPIDGGVLRAGLALAPGFLGSDPRFVRWTAEGAAYRQARLDWVVAGFLRLGSVLGSASFDPREQFLPPEERFYAGGAYTVRGFARNRLGPGVYFGPDPVFDPDDVRFVPVGGTSVVVANAELRTPAPFARRFLRFALFVDGGAVGTGQLWELRAEDIRVTPGLGVRATTPVGPARLDIAYNPYPPPTGPLFLPDPATGALIRIADAFAPDAPGLLRRFRLHVALGHAF